MLKPLIRKIISRPRMFLRFIKHPVKAKRLFRYMKDYNSRNTRPDFHASIKELYPCLSDWGDNAGSQGYYFWQDLWAARKIYSLRPSEHYDIGSRLDGFIAHVLPFMPELRTTL